MKKTTALYFSGIILLFSACYKNSLEELSDQGDCKTADISYNNDIRRIINIHCNISGCHNASTVETFPLVSYQQLKAEVTSGLLLKVINHEPGVEAMPKNVSKLADCYIQQITSWVNAGAPDN